MVPLIIVLIVAVIVLAVFARSIRIVPQARARVVERLGRYHRTLTPGMSLIVPFIDRLRPFIDLRETVVSFPPQPVITEDNLVVNIDSVIYFQVTDAKAASYEIRSEEHTSELQSQSNLVCRLLLAKKKNTHSSHSSSRTLCPSCRATRPP